MAYSYQQFIIINIAIIPMQLSSLTLSLAIIIEQQNQNCSIIMGSSISQDQHPTAVADHHTSPQQVPSSAQTPPQEKPTQLALLENIEVTNVDTAEDYLKPSNKENSPRKSQDTAPLLYKPKRELPPLKKIRSLKKVDLLLNQNLEKENTSFKSIDEVIQKDQYQFSKKGGKEPDIEVSQLKETENEEMNKVRETRTKKMRVSKNMGIGHGAYF